MQLDNGVKIPPSGWQCEKCDLTNNLWLNLTDGSILCGRKFFDGSGGNGHAVDYYSQKGNQNIIKTRFVSLVLSVLSSSLNDRLSHKKKSIHVASPTRIYEGEWGVCVCITFAHFLILFSSFC